MAPKCPYCETRIRAKDVDLERDSVVCRRCGRTLSFSSLPGVGDNPGLRRVLEKLRPGPVTPTARVTPGRVGSVPSLAPERQAPAALAAPTTQARGSGVAVPAHPGAAVSLAEPPAGAWYRDDGMTLEVGASTRSIGMAIFMLLIGTFWCSITGVFVIIALTGIVQGLGLAGGGNHGGGMGVGFSAFMLLFCAPFVCVGFWMYWTALMSMGGREVVTIRGDALEHFSGIGPFGFRKRLSAASVKRVTLDVQVSRTKSGTTTTKRVALYTGAPKPVLFGALLGERRREFMIGALGQVLTPTG